MIQGLWQWYLARPTGVKVAIGLSAIVLAIVLSPGLSALASLVLFVSIIALLYRLVRRRPLRTLAIVAGASLALALVAGGVSDALYWPAEQANVSQQASEQSSADKAELKEARQQAEEARREAEAAKEEAARANAEATQAMQEAEEAREDAKADSAETDSEKPNEKQPDKAESDVQDDAKAQPVVAKKPVEKADRPEPQTPEERLRSRIEKTFVVKKDIRGIWIRDSGTGCKNVAVGFVGEGWTAGGTVDSVEYQMEEVYRAAYADPQVANSVCYVTANAYAKLTDNLGNVTTEQVYSTTMDQATGKSINWRNSYAVDFPTVWAVNYEHPTFTRQKAQNALEHAADCAEDEGLFDMQPLDCP